MADDVTVTLTATLDAIKGPTRCAVVDKNGDVINTIMADPNVDAPPDGCTLVPIPPEATVDETWTAYVVGDDVIFADAVVEVAPQ